MGMDIVCPHCKHVFTDDDMADQRYLAGGSQDDLYGIAPNEETTQAACPACVKRFFIKGGYKPEYKTFKTEEGLDLGFDYEET